MPISAPFQKLLRTTSGRGIFYAALLFVLHATSSFAGNFAPDYSDLLSADRRVDWTNVGVKGGIPNRTTICATLSPSGGDDTNAIQNAIEDCPDNQVVKLSSGTFTIDGLDWQPVGNGVVIRGNGPTNTIIKTSGTILIRGMWYDVSLAGMQKSNLTASATKGATSITVADASWICSGGVCGENDYYIIDQTNDPSLVTDVSEDYPNDPAESVRYPGNRGLGQIVRVTAKSGNTLTLDIPLYYAYSTAFTAQIAKAAVDWKSYRGIEDLKIENTSSDGDTNTIKFENAANSWLKNVEIANTGRTAVLSMFSYRLEIRDCFIHHAMNYDSGQGYGVALYHVTSASLIQNNTLQHLHLYLSGDYGPSGNVFSYNYAFDPHSRSGQEPGYGTHGMHTYMNLIEGNIFTTKFGADETHGSGSHQVLLRNRIQGHDTSTVPENNYDQVPIHLMRYNRHGSAIANVLGLANYSTKYKAIIDGCDNGTVICLGDGYDGNDDEATMDFLRVANYDYSPTHNCTWSDASNRCMTAAEVNALALPASFYLASKPTWFGSLAWPPIGPDVNGLSTTIPAKYCFEHGQMPNCLESPPQLFTLTVNKAGSANGSISGNGILNCSASSCTTQAGGAVTLSATYDNTVARVSWSGACSGSNATCSFTMSAPATVTATFSPLPNVAPSITAQPLSQTVLTQNTATFSAVASGVPTPRYQWEKASPGETFAAITNATASSYTTPSLTLADSGTQFRVVATNSSGSATSATATLTVQQGIANQIGHWNFDEASGSTSADASGNNNTATLTGAVRINGKVGPHAIGFDGTTFVTIADSAALDLTGAGTLATWVKFNQIGNGWRAIVAKGSGSDDSQAYALEVNTSQNKWSALLSNGTTQGYSQYTQTTALLTGTWYHVVATWDGTNFKLYLNGTLRTSTAQSVIPQSNSSALTIGNYGSPSSEALNGAVDDVYLYNRALSAAEVQALFALGAATSLPSAPSNLRVHTN